MSDIKFARRPLLSQSATERAKYGAGVLALLFGFAAVNMLPEEERTQEDSIQGQARYYERQGCDVSEFLRGGLVHCPPETADNE